MGCANSASTSSPCCIQKKKDLKSEKIRVKTVAHTIAVKPNALDTDGRRRKTRPKKAVSIAIGGRSDAKNQKIIIYLALTTQPKITLSLFSCFNLLELIRLGQVSK